ncbi:hypothetical protein [Nocardioides sp. L-11A]|uniref:hypothetical protein n=1 Tax=Nocardioides sp. L-11A TaxID=3043848 RepID=UPI00249B18F5|nr:hypothetical protein QJ852_09795 [Nocardioides sp. L-11A]
MTQHAETDPMTADIPSAAAAEQPEPAVTEYLDLDAVLSGAAILAERTEILYTKPHLEAQLDALDFEIQRLTSGAAPKSELDESAVGDSPVSADGRSVEALIEERQAKRREYIASGRKVLLRQMNGDAWAEFEAKWKKELAAKAPYPMAMWNELLAASLVSPAASVEKVAALRKKFGAPALEKLARSTWEMNTEGGVSVPF